MFFLFKLAEDTGRKPLWIYFVKLKHFDIRHFLFEILRFSLINERQQHLFLIFCRRLSRVPTHFVFFPQLIRRRPKNINNHFSPFACPACPMEFSSFHSIGVKSFSHFTGAPCGSSFGSSCPFSLWADLGNLNLLLSKSLIPCRRALWSI